MKNFCFICGLLGSFLILSTAQAVFTDVPSSQTNYEAINYVQAKKIVQGYNDGSFKPDTQINRAELTKIIIATQYKDTDITNCNVYNTGLSDVPAEAWFGPYVCTAKANNIIKGYGDGTFKPAQNVTFVEAAKIISLGFGQQLPEDTELWYRPYVNYLSAQSAIPETITAMAKNITRGEMAEMIYRLHAAVESRPAQAFDNGALVPMTDEIKTQQKAAQEAGLPLPQTSPAPTPSPQTTPTAKPSISPPQPTLQNPMICQACPSGTIGQPSNNCACETAYLYELTYPIEQCDNVEFTCGEGYEYFIDTTQCGCKLKKNILDYWLYTDPSFKLNALEDQAPIIHGSYEELTTDSITAALGSKNIILFFYADWNASSVTTDQEIKDRITELPADAVILKTDYDTEITLREKFEITAPHSIVIIDKNNALQFKQTGFNFDDIVSVLEKIKEAQALSE